MSCSGRSPGARLANRTSPRKRTTFLPYLSPMRPVGIWNTIMVIQNAMSMTVIRNRSSMFLLAHRVQNGPHMANDVTAR